MADNKEALPVLPDPFDYCYEWDGIYGIRKFSHAPHNGRKCDRSVPLFNAQQMHAFREAGVSELRAEVERLRAELKRYEGKPGELPKYITQCFGCEGFPSGSNNPCDVCGRSAARSASPTGEAQGSAEGGV